MEDTLFAKIARKEVRADMVYEDDEVIAFLDIHPINPGHTLVVPKRAVRNIFDVDENTFEAVMRAVRRIAPAVRDAVGAEGMNIHSNHEAAAGQVVFHLHIHLIPRFKNDGYHLWSGKTYPHGDAETVAQKIRNALEARKYVKPTTPSV